MVRTILLFLSTALFLSCELPILVSTSVSTPRPNIRVSLDSGVGQATALWDPVSGAEEYRVAWTASSSDAVGSSVDTAATTAVVDHLVPGVGYKVTVTALGQGEPLAQGTATWSSEGWTWESGVTSHTTATSSDVQSYDLGDGNWLVVITERTTALDLFSRLSFTSGGFSRTNWLRTTTSPPKTDEPEVVEKLVQTVAAAWVEPWTSFTAPDEEAVTFSADRKTFTLASSPGIEWHWVP